MNPFVIYLYARVLEIAACRALGLKLVNRFGGVNFLTKKVATRLGHRRRQVFRDHSSIAVSWTSFASNDDQTFQAGCNDASVKASASANVRLASINWRYDFPCPRLVCEY